MEKPTKAKTEAPRRMSVRNKSTPQSGTLEQNGERVSIDTALQSQRKAHRGLAEKRTDEWRGFLMRAVVSGGAKHSLAAIERGD